MRKQRSNRSNRCGNLSLISGIIATFLSLAPVFSFIIGSLLFRYQKLWYFYYLKYGINNLSWKGTGIGFLLGVAALIFSLLQKERQKTKSANAGFVLGIIAMVLPVLYFLFIILGFLYLVVKYPGGSW